VESNALRGYWQAFDDGQLYIIFPIMSLPGCHNGGPLDRRLDHEGSATWR
jgi:hypothetical protein